MAGRPHVAVLGSGILGTSTALFLARRGAAVTLVDAAPEPFSQASRWNEGKIHLGHLYAADPTRRTAARLLPGGLAFKDLVEQLTGRSLDDVVTAHDDTYVVHRSSIVPAEDVGAYLGAVTGLAASLPGADRYFVGLSRARVRRLRRAELAADYDTEQVVAGFRVPERSVATNPVADRFVAALAAEPGIGLLLGARVTGVRHRDEGGHGPLVVATDRGEVGPHDFVVNALWEGRMAVDASLGLGPRARWSHRYRVALFLRTRSPVSVPSSVVVTGPYGDVKAYTERDFYVSWYRPGLLAEGAGLAPPPVPSLTAVDRHRIQAEILGELGRIVRPVGQLAAAAEQVRVNGGWVFALGRGPLDDRRSTVHRRTVSASAGAAATSRWTPGSTRRAPGSHSGWRTRSSRPPGEAGRRGRRACGGYPS